jgi:hypothetical protein
LAAQTAAAMTRAVQTGPDSQHRRENMSFALYMIGFLIFLAGLIWGASAAGVPTLYIGIGTLIVLGIGIFSAVGRTRGKDPS